MNDARSAAVIPLRPSAVDAHADLVAFLFTDIEGSSLKWLNHRAAMQEALRVHDEILRKAVAAHGGEVFKTGGDAFSAAFRRPSDAVGAAIDAQQALARADFGSVDGLAVRMAVHVGTAERREGDYFGPALNRVARLLSLGHGGQVLVTSSASELIAAERENRHTLRHLGAHPLDDPLQPVDVHQVDVPGLPHEFPPLRTTENRPTNLPRQPTPLIGRDAELERISALLSQNPLVTVTGTGGVGKTRITLEAGARLLERFPDGVWLVELAAISDASLVPSAATNALAVDTSSAKTPQEALLSRLKHQHLLLLLDNCEHVIEAVASLVESLLAVAPNVRVLVSSQEPLGIGGEQVFRLPSLAVPKDAQVRSDDAMRAGAVQLFVERAKGADPRFALDDRNAATVAAICRRLDGIPLAIEMAAARAPMLGVDKLAQKLDERFRVLTGGRRTALPRQQTLRATLDWSYGLLSERERTVLRRLSIFAGGFTLDGAGCVASDDAVDEFEVIDLLSHLVARSLVVADTDEGGTRYRLLETTRAYALEKLADARESPAIERLHATFFRDLFERAYDDWQTTPDVEWRDTYLPERDNLRNALDWAFGPNGDTTTGIEIAGASFQMWWQLSLTAEGRQRMEAMAPHVDERLPPHVAGRFWLAFGRFWSNIAPLRGAEARARAAALFRDANLTAMRAEALVLYAQGLPATSEFDAKAQAALAEAWPLVEQAALPRLLGQYFDTSARLRIVSNPVLARDHFESALRHFRRAGAEGQVLNTLNNLADFTWSTGDLSAAVASMHEAVARVRSSPVSNRTLLGQVLANLGGVLIEQGEIDEALVTLREAMPMVREGGWFFRFGDHLALRLVKAGRADAAARLLGYTDAEHARFEANRQVNEARAHESVLAILSAAMAPAELAQRMAEGAKLTEDEAARLALEP